MNSITHNIRHKVIGPHKPYILFAGLGNYFYPKQRQSIGLNLVSEFAERRGMGWKSLYELPAELSTYDNIILARSRTFQSPDFPLCVLAALRYYNVSMERVYVLHYDTTIPVGFVKIRFGGNTKNPFIHSLIKVLNAQDFYHVGVGIAPRDKRLKFRNQFNLATVPEDSLLDELHLMNPLRLSELPYSTLYNTLIDDIIELNEARPLDMKKLIQEHKQFIYEKEAESLQKDSLIQIATNTTPIKQKVNYDEYMKRHISPEFSEVIADLNEARLATQLNFLKD
eukprot:TRINITY_DN102_c2_g1_i1.p1 TRINITY_DN102_c2_g1~~TRINITY_DN102_c2_g1_i1.p1  ORF type:complete len:282 (-),score=124.19 TRINITY_DN102_c2_g1_i1:100-945(-)